MPLAKYAKTCYAIYRRNLVMINKMFFLFLAPVLLVFSGEVSAQKNPKNIHHVTKALTTTPTVRGSVQRILPLKEIDAHLTYPDVSAPPAAWGIPIVDKKAVRHSLYPSQALVVVQSESFPNKRQPFSFSEAASQYKIENTLTQNYIMAKESARWRQTRDELNTLWIQMRPSFLGELSSFLRHPVPKETMEYLKNTYSQVVTQSQITHDMIFPWIVYASIPGEGRSLLSEEREKFNTALFSMLHQVQALRSSLPSEPYLEQQENFWITMLSRFNPLLESALQKPTELSLRTDRVLKTTEFNLLNPDGTDYLLPRSETLIRDPDEIEELDSYAVVREKMRNPPITPERAALEREELLAQLPENMRIAFINDDALPRLNFKRWAEQGFLGKNAQVEIFPNGFDFMNKMRNGRRYDLVITDLLVPYAGLVMMPELRTISPQTVVIASSKYDRGEEPEEKLFSAGIDGYLWYNTNLNEGAYGYIEYLRALKNYFYYKNLHGWER